MNYFYYDHWDVLLYYSWIKIRLMQTNKREPDLRFHCLHRLVNIRHTPFNVSLLLLQLLLLKRKEKKR